MFNRKINTILLFVFISSFSITAYGAPKLTWDASTGDVKGYKIFYGQSSGTHSQNFDVGNKTECPLTDLSIQDQTKYYFVVKAYNEVVLSDPSNEVSWESGDSTPPISPQGFSVNVELGQAHLQWQINSEDDLNGYYAYCGESTRNYAPPIPVGKNTTYSLTNLEEGKQYYFAISAIDTSGNESGYSNEIVKTIPTSQNQTPPIADPSPGDTTDSNGIEAYNLIVASGKTYEIKSGLDNNLPSYIDRDYSYKNIPEDLRGATFIKTANNDKLSSENDFMTFEIKNDALIYIAHDNRIIDKPDWLTTFSDTGHEIITADVPMTLFVKKFFQGDQVTLGGNSAEDSTCNMYTVILKEEIEPEVIPAVEDPLMISNLMVASGRNYQISNGLTNGANSYIDRSYHYKNIDSTLSDAFFIETANTDKLSKGEQFLQFETNKDAVVYIAHDSRITKKPAWLSDFNETGKTIITADVPMSLFVKLFPKGKISLGGNYPVDSICNMYTVIIKEGTATVELPLLDVTPPIIKISNPTSEGNYVCQEDIISISGQSQDNDEVTKVTWKNAGGGSGTANGLVEWSISDISLFEGDNILTVNAEDAAGNIGSEQIIITFSPQDTSAPTLTITSPTSQSNYLTESTTIDIGGISSDNILVSQVSWSSSTGGNGIATGTSTWNIPRLDLTEGENIITVEAMDEAGNIKKETLTVICSPKIPANDDPLMISNLMVTSGKNYKISQGLTNGINSYIDRSYHYKNVDNTLSGAFFIETANNDKLSGQEEFLTFEINKEASVYIAHDSRITQKPGWLSDFDKTDKTIITADVPMSLFVKSFPKGKITLGGNKPLDSGCNMYTVIIK